MADQLDPAGVPLAQYRQIGADVLLQCCDCQDRRTYGLEAVIERLALRGVGGERTGIKALAGMVRQACPRCGGWRFETRPDFARMPGQ